MRLARFFGIAAVVASLASCAYWAGEGIGMPVNGGRPQILPLRALLMRPGIDDAAMQFCTSRDCGVDVAMMKVRVSGPERDRLRRDITEPDTLRRLAEHGETRPPLKQQVIGRRRMRQVRAAVTVERVTVGAWRGLAVAMSARPTGKHVHGIVLEHDDGTAATDFIMVISADRNVTRRFAEAAAR